MNIAIIGFGKLGQKIEEQIQQDKNTHLVLKINSKNLLEFTPTNLKNVDVAIELSGPENAFENLKKLALNNIPTVCGSTGWTSQYDQIKNIFKQQKGSFLYASNFSLGMNIFFAMNQKLAKIMSNKGFKAEINEIHHVHKLDSPSGTSLTLANDIINNHSQYDQWSMEENSYTDRTILINAERKGEVKGDHTVTYKSQFEFLELHHSALDRAAFAEGALAAAKWISNKQGIFTMKNVLDL